MDRIKYKGKILEIVEFDVTQGGKSLVFECARRSPGVRLIIPKGDTILLSREERHEVGGYDYRLPGGKVFDTLEEYSAALESGKDIQAEAAEAAKREAREEVGIHVTDLSFFHKSVCGTTVVWDLFYFVANSFADTTQELGEGEDIRVEAFDRETVKKMCLDGSIQEERSALLLLRYLSSSSL
ncbi:MAG: NUDIX domain-containing protein [Patescibacteria group bacterium]